MCGLGRAGARGDMARMLGHPSASRRGGDGHPAEPQMRAVVAGAEQRLQDVAVVPERLVTERPARPSDAP